MAQFKNAYIPYSGYYVSPFVKWMGKLQNINSIELGGQTAHRWLEHKGIDPATEFDHLYLGITVGQPSWFYGSPWAAKLIGAPNIPSNTVQHACATATTGVYNAALAVETGNIDTGYVMLTDRPSNGPHTVWPNPSGPGGEVISENWNMDNINCDPSTGCGMLSTAENVAKKYGFTKQQADELTFRRYQQYNDSLANDREFQKKYMFDIDYPVNRKVTIKVDHDEGVTDTSPEAIAKLRAVAEDGIHSFAAQTHPADANGGIIVTTKDNAARLSADPSIPVQIISYAATRGDAGFMPAVPALASKKALEKAGLAIEDIKVVKNHNPFIANDLHLAQALGIDPYNMNNYGSSLVFGHPQAPTLARLLIEAIEETVLLGGGYALVTGCAAGDNAAAIIVKVG